MAPQKGGGAEEAEAGQDRGPGKGEAQKEARQLDSITDRVEAVALDEGVAEANASKVQVAMQEIAARDKAEAAARRQRDKELAAVKVSMDDVAVVVEEFELDKKAADRALREHGGDLAQTLEALVDAA